MKIVCFIFVLLITGNCLAASYLETYEKNEALYADGKISETEYEHRRALLFEQLHLKYMPKRYIARKRYAPRAMIIIPQTPELTKNSEKIRINLLYDALKTAVQETGLNVADIRDAQRIYAEIKQQGQSVMNPVKLQKICKENWCSYIFIPEFLEFAPRREYRNNIPAIVETFLPKNGYTYYGNCCIKLNIWSRAHNRMIFSREFNWHEKINYVEEPDFFDNCMDKKFISFDELIAGSVKKCFEKLYYYARPIIEKEYNKAFINNTHTMHYAAENGYDELIKILIARRYNVNIPDSSGQTALFKAVRAVYPDTVKLLLECGADTGIRDTDGKRAIWYAYRTKNADIISMLEAMDKE